MLTPFAAFVFYFSLEWLAQSTDIMKNEIYIYIFIQGGTAKGARE